MTDRVELLEALVDSVPEGIAVIDEKCTVAFWNQAACAITGHTCVDLLGRPAPEKLIPLLKGCSQSDELELASAPQSGRGSLVHASHKLGQDVRIMARTLVLRDGLGHRIGTAVLFHPADTLDALPRGESGDDEAVEASQTDLEDRLTALFDDLTRSGPPFGVLWVSVDQARDLRSTHGASACESMLARVEHALERGLRPGEHIGRWGQDEFLVISHERTPAMLAVHAQALAGIARTADFRWWGDRISLTVSIGAAQAEPTGTLADLLERAKAAMSTSFEAGGNQVSQAPGGSECSPS